MSSGGALCIADLEKKASLLDNVSVDGTRRPYIGRHKVSISDVFKTFRVLKVSIMYSKDCWICLFSGPVDVAISLALEKDLWRVFASASGKFCVNAFCLHPKSVVAFLLRLSLCIQLCIARSHTQPKQGVHISVLLLPLHLVWILYL